MDIMYQELEESCGYDREYMRSWLEHAIDYLECNWDAYEESEEDYD